MDTEIIDAQLLIDLINQYGFPIVAAVGMGYFVYFIYGFVTTKLTPLIGETSTILIALIDRVRCLDNDLIRLHQKVNTVLHLRGHLLEQERITFEKSIKSQTDVDIVEKKDK
jgi:hypothetical protein